jgi:hypothetical protein
MGSPGVGGTISAASDTSLSNPVTDDLFIRQGAYWANVPVINKAAAVDRGGLEKVVTANASGTYSINVTNGNVFFVTLTGAGTGVTFSFAALGSNPGRAVSCTLYVKQGTTLKTVTWPSSATLKWAGGVAPALTQAANKVDIFVFETVDGGTTWYGSLVGNNF